MKTRQEIEVEIRSKNPKTTIQVSANNKRKSRVISTIVGSGSFKDCTTRLIEMFNDAANDLKVPVQDVYLRNRGTYSYLYTTRLQTDEEYEKWIKDLVDYEISAIKIQEVEAKQAIENKNKRIKQLEDALLQVNNELAILKGI